MNKKKKQHFSHVRLNCRFDRRSGLQSRAGRITDVSPYHGANRNALFVFFANHVERRENCRAFWAFDRSGKVTGVGARYARTARRKGRDFRGVWTRPTCLTRQCVSRRSHGIPMIRFAPPRRGRVSGPTPASRRPARRSTRIRTRAVGDTEITRD